MDEHDLNGFRESWRPESESVNVGSNLEPIIARSRSVLVSTSQSAQLSRSLIFEFLGFEFSVALETWMSQKIT